MRRIQKWVIFTLISITIISMLLRVIKLYEFAIWGSDSGEHYFLINQLIRTGKIELEYNGWGLAYPYFQGMHVYITGFVQTANISSYQGLTLIVPITAAFSVVLVFCISNILCHDPRVGLMSAAFIGVVLPHVYSSSHPMPGSLGGVFLLLCIFLLLKTYDNKRFLIPLILTSFALVITHHMTTYFLIITVIMVILIQTWLQYRNAKPKLWLFRTRLNIIYLLLLVTIALIYWLSYAAPFYDKILLKVLPIPSFGFFILGYLGIGLLWLIVEKRKKIKYEFHLV